MFLKSLTMRGFKSFVERTTLEFEPGITVIVGPNGSGKSNVVDALAWVLGTRSPKLLRGGELADVIFAGSPMRPALGRASVEITIDNSLRLLGSGATGTGGSAQEFSEVTISREIHASGESVYAINGTPCRLLDIEELLSDTGLGRELHTVVGQGQLDDILHAKPEDRRAFIEEAAGILKHRRRRERADRKLAQVDVHLEQLKTVLRELRRQLRPLERQAEAAGKHARLGEELTAVRLRIAAHDLARLRAEVERMSERDATTSGQAQRLEAEVAEVSEAVERLEGELRESAPLLDEARAATEHLARLKERLQGTAGLVEARRRHLLEYVEEPLAGRPPDELRAHAERLDEQRAERHEQRRQAATVLEAAIEKSRDAQIARREIDRRIADVARERAEARERYARFAGEVDARRSALAAAESEARRLAERASEIDEEIAAAEREVEAIQGEIRALDTEEWRLTERLEEAEAAAATAETLLEEAVEAVRAAHQARSSELARAEALRDASAENGIGTEALSAAGEDVLGFLADGIRVARGAEAAVAAALGPVGDAVVARSKDAAGRVIAHLREEGIGRAVVLPGVDGAGTAGRGGIDGLVPLATRLEARGRDGRAALAVVERLLQGTYLVESWAEAVAAHTRHPDATFVTVDGDVAGPRGYVGGSGPEPSVVLRAAAAEEAERRAAELEREIEAASRRVERARADLDARRADLEVATSAMHESDARITGAAEDLARANRSLDDLRAERSRVRAQIDDLTAAADGHRRALDQLESAGPHEPTLDDGPIVTETEIEVADEAVERARRDEIEARLRVERLEEQIRHLERSAADLREEAVAVEHALAEAARRRELRRTHIRRCGELAATAEEALAALTRSMEDAEAERTRLDVARRDREEELDALRRRLRSLMTSLDETRERRHAEDLEHAALRRDLDDLVTRVRDTSDVTVEELAEQHPEAATYDRDALSAREDDLVRRIDLLGRVNPLALEEFEALEQRHAFLSEQMNDLRASRRDLREVIDAVDDKIREVFAHAFEDVAQAFVEVFATVFPGGEGRLVLTDPDDLLTTGIEVEARPPGKKIRRLSLLSGGERSLTALAFLFAIFRARPSPFYVLDEVEAALDDVNLARLVSVLESFKEHAQLIVVTHQKRTMEAADILYGVTMNEQAVSKVVAERVKEAAAV